MDKLRLKWKIFAFLIGFCALLLMILWMFQTVFLDSFYKSIREFDIRKNADIIAVNLKNDSIIEMIDEISKGNDLGVDITDLDGNSFLLSHDMPESRTNENLRLISRAKNNNGEFHEYTPSRPSPPSAMSGRRIPSLPQSLIYVKLADFEQGGQIAIIMRAVISPVSATVTTLRYQLYVISGVMLLLSVILAIIIAKRISKPIEDISRSAVTLAKGNYDTHFEGKGFFEIVALSETLNTAAVELGKVEGLRRELLANVSHDLRTPLALIYSYAEMMNDFPDEITQDQTKVIMDETQRLTVLVNDVLDMSKLENEMERLNISKFNLTSNISETTERIQELLKNEDFEISFKYEDEVYVKADETKVCRAFYNLLINAINYSGDSRIVIVAQTVTEGRVRISVTDSGIGIESGDLPFIWNRYYQSGKKHKRAVAGTGLGLTIVKKIIDMHGGSYGVSTGIGKGSTFWFELTGLNDQR